MTQPREVIPPLMSRQEPEVIELELSANELVDGLLALHPSRRACVLDSGGVRTDGRYLIGGFDPVETIEAYGEELHIRSDAANRPRIERGSVLERLDRRLSSEPVARVPDWDLPVNGGACIAALAYDLSQQFEKSPRYAIGARRHGLDAALAFFDVLVVHDYASRKSFIVGTGTTESRLASISAALRQAANERKLTVHSQRPARLERARSNFTREQYIAAVERIREHIFAGDIYQANLTQQITCGPTPGASPEEVFLRLRIENPASFAAFIRLRDGVIVSASPERFLRIKASMIDGSTERVIEAWPIKGTRPRGLDQREDAEFAAQLLASGKDTAENVMIVDLMRNDLGRVCRYGSVIVEELCTLQEHPTLFHLVSKVRGILRDEQRPSGVLRATFPSGSITGAPKLRAMQILREVETEERGFSMGALGYLSDTGELDLNVAIRTITFTQDGVAQFNVGGGIVAESDPAAEFDESLLKARALLRALGAELTI